MGVLHADGGDFEEAHGVLRRIARLSVIDFFA
jgi:hypothetical protein